jgi:hypothetical protein
VLEKARRETFGVGGARIALPPNYRIQFSTGKGGQRGRCTSRLETLNYFVANFTIQ